MEKYRIEDMVKGWFVGDFEPSVIKTKTCEVGVKFYKSGSKESAHYHKKAIELTVIVKGKVRMNDAIFETGDIVKVFEYEVVDFEAIEDTTTVVYKSTSKLGDKYLAAQADSLNL